MNEEKTLREIEEAKKTHIAGLVLNGDCPDATIGQLKDVAGFSFIAGLEWMRKQLIEKIEKLKEKSAEYDDAFLEGYQWCAHDILSLLNMNK